MVPCCAGLVDVVARTLLVEEDFRRPIRRAIVTASLANRPLVEGVECCACLSRAS